MYNGVQYEMRVENGLQGKVDNMKGEDKMFYKGVKWILDKDTSNLQVEEEIEVLRKNFSFLNLSSRDVPHKVLEA